MSERKNKIGEVLVYFIWGLWLVSNTIFASTIDDYIFFSKQELDEIVTVSICTFLVLKITLLQKYTFEEVLLIILISIVLLFATYNSDYRTLIATWLFVIAAKNTNFEVLIKLAYWIQIIMCTFVIYLCFTGYINDVTMYRNSIVRHSMGFSHPNQLGIRFFQILLCRFYLCRKKRFFNNFIVVLIFAIVVNMVTNSQTAFYEIALICLMIVVNEFLKLFKCRKIIWNNIMIGSFVVCNIFSIIFSVINVKRFSLLSVIDTFISNRFSQCHRVFEFYGYTIWGQKISLLVKRIDTGMFYHFFLDNAYMSIFMRYGIVVWILFSLIYFLTMIYLRNKNQTILLEILFLYSIYGIMENNLFIMTQNLFLFLLSCPIYCKSKEIVVDTKEEIT